MTTDNRGRLWTRDRVISVFQAFAMEHNRAPKYTELGTGDLPWPRSVERIFGSHNKAVRAAGLRPRPAARPRVWVKRRIRDAA